MKILVIEDELYVADLICTILEEMGASCLLARNAGEADDLLRRREVDGVTLDLGMPGRGGLDWLESLAQSRPELASRTLVVTGMSLEPPARRRLDRCGAGFLAKPFTVEDLQEAIAACLLPDEALEPLHN
jgi:two-component system response regulator QseB